MSLKALDWAISTQLIASSEKFVLVVLSNYADALGYAYPSVERICLDTSQDRKTVIEHLGNLKKKGLIRDSGSRVGSTGSIVVYQLVGVPEFSKIHYVYRLTHPDTKEYYIGKRSFDGDCADKDLYRGSGKWPLQMTKHGILLVREVLEMANTSEEALAKESEWVRKCGDDTLCKNLDSPQHRRRMTKAAPKTEQHSSPKNGTTGTRQEMPSSPVFPSKQSRFSVEAVPKTGHRSERNPQNPQVGGDSAERFPRIKPGTMTPQQIFWMINERLKSASGSARKKLLKERDIVLQAATGIDLTPEPIKEPTLPAEETAPPSPEDWKSHIDELKAIVALAKHPIPKQKVRNRRVKLETQEP